MAVGLEAYLRQGMATPFIWGEVDCCLWPCAWIALASGVDPADGLRGAYRTRDEAAVLIEGEGGFERMWRSRMERFGFAETAAPVPGDVGVVTDLAGQTVAVIRLSDGVWAGKQRRGVVISPFPMIAAWSIPCQR